MSRKRNHPRIAGDRRLRATRRRTSQSEAGRNGSRAKSAQLQRVRRHSRRAGRCRNHRGEYKRWRTLAKKVAPASCRLFQEKCHPERSMPRVKRRARGVEGPLLRQLLQSSCSASSPKRVSRLIAPRLQCSKHKCSPSTDIFVKPKKPTAISAPGKYSVCAWPCWDSRSWASKILEVKIASAWSRSLKSTAAP